METRSAKRRRIAQFRCSCAVGGCPTRLLCTIFNSDGLEEDVCELVEETEIEAVNAARADGCTALYLACGKGWSRVTATLLEKGADVDAEVESRHNGVTPLLVASFQVHVEVVRELLAHRADVDKADNNGFTALFAACSQGHVEVVRELLTVSNAGLEQSAAVLVAIASNDHHPELAAWLVECAGWNRLQHACEARREALVRSMLRDESLAATTSRRSLLGAVGERGWTALGIAGAGPDSGLGACVLPVSESLVGLVRLAGEDWCPLNHALWPASFRRAVWTVLLVAHRSPLPEDVWLHVLSFASWSWFQLPAQ